MHKSLRNKNSLVAYLKLVTQLELLTLLLVCCLHKQSTTTTHALVVHNHRTGSTKKTSDVNCNELAPRPSMKRVHPRTQRKSTKATTTESSASEDDHKQQTTTIEPFIVTVPATPKCIFENETKPLGLKWILELVPFGPQYCLMLECTLSYSTRDSCYEPVVRAHRFRQGDFAATCPESPDVCQDGSSPKPMPGHPCCLTCDVAASQEAHEKHLQASAWLTSPTARRLTTTTVRPPTANDKEYVGKISTTTGVPPVGYSGVGFDLNPQPETIWLFKVIAKTGDNRELISAVKPAPICEDWAERQLARQHGRQRRQREHHQLTET